IGDGVGARGAADGRLVDLDHLVAMFEAGDLVVCAGDDAGAVEGAGGAGVERVDGGAGLAGAGDAGDAGKGAERDGGGDVLQVVGAGAVDGDLLAVALAAFGRDFDPAGAVEVGGGEGVFGLQDFG